MEGRGREGNGREGNGKEENDSIYFAKKNPKGYFASNMQQY